MNVELVRHSASDLDVVNAARVSYGRTTEHLGPEDVRLINVLIQEGHGSPFEHTYLQFRCRVPIFVAREWMRHRIGSYNELSMRYMVPDNIEFYFPKSDRQRIGKAMNYEHVEREWDSDDYYFFTSSCEEALATYRHMLHMGTAPEVARMVLPVNTYTTFLWSVNARSMMNFLRLRLDKTAMQEIRECATMVNDAFNKVMPVTYAAWHNNGKPNV